MSLAPTKSPGRAGSYLMEAGGIMSPDWWHRRWIRTDISKVPGYYHNLCVHGNSLAKPKLVDKGWRANWLWTPLFLSGELPQRMFCYDDVMRVQLRTLLRVETRLVAVRVGPDRIYFFGTDEQGRVQRPSFYYPEHEDEQFIGTATEIENLILTYQAGPVSITYV